MALATCCVLKNVRERNYENKALMQHQASAIVNRHFQQYLPLLQ